MAEAPGKHYIGSPVSRTANFQTAAGSDVDPTTVTFWTCDPLGCQTSYVYGTDSEVVKDSVGDYTATIIPDSPGRWFWKWITTGTNTVVVSEGDFLVQDSPFYTGELGIRLMAGINDLTGFTGPTQGGIKPNALAGSWGGSAASGSDYDFTQQWGQQQQQGYPDWRRWRGMQRGGGSLSRTMGNPAQAMAGAAPQQNMGRPMGQADPAPYAAPQAPQPIAAPAAGFVDNGRSAMQPQPQQNALWNNYGGYGGGAAGGYIR